jgi:hypothetical protein
MKEKSLITNQASFDSIVVEHSTADHEIKSLNQPTTPWWHEKMAERKLNIKPGQQWQQSGRTLDC